MPKLGAMGTVLFFVASLNVLEPGFFNLPRLKSFALSNIKRLGLTFRKLAVEQYPGHENARTVVAFLSESHLALTAYPEQKVLELEVASCKPMPMADYIHWLSTSDFYEIKTSFLLDKDERGTWTRSI